MPFTKSDASAAVKALVVGGFLMVLAAAGWVLWYRSSDGPVVNSYQSCVDAGNLVQTSYPSVCADKNGNRFTGPSDGVFQPPAEGMVPKSQ